jgi:predicted CopG family antitoxin
VTKQGFKPVMVRQEAYDQAFKEAKAEETSISEVVSKAIQWYLNRKLEVEDTIRTIYRVYEEAQRKPSASPSASHTS